MKFDRCWVEYHTFTCELSVVFSRTLITTNNTFNVLIFVTTVHTVLRILRRSLPVVDQRQVGVVQRYGVQIRRQRVQIAGGQRVQRVGQRVDAGWNRVHQRRLSPRTGHQSHFSDRLYTFQTPRNSSMMMFPHFARNVFRSARELFWKFRRFLGNPYSRSGARIRGLEVIGHPLGTL